MTARDSSSGRPSCAATDPSHEVFTTEYFGPILAVYVYDDRRSGRRIRRQSWTWWTPARRTG